ncbi:MAG: gliding motility-associated ABC transporter substrate-binding protein GldG [Candidatus Cyclobacteriaceae bacterium M2_1C_046]
MDSKRLNDILKLFIGLVLLVWINLLSSEYFFRVDLTEENRYSIKEPTKELLRQLDDRVYIEVYLQGQLNAPFQRFQNAIRETLEEFEIYSDHKVQFQFIDPAQAKSEKAQREFMMSLVNKGITPTNIIEEQDGERREHIVFPGAVVAYGGQEEGVMLLKGQRGESAISQSIETIEYNFASAIKKLTEPENKRVGLVRGHEELDSLEIFAFRNLLQEKYLVDEVYLREDNPLDLYNALIIAKPKQRFSEEEKFLLDQYIMKGGSVLFLIDMLDADMEALAEEENIAFPYDINLQDQLFRYGVRINIDLVQDNQAARHPIVVGSVGDQPQIRMMPWPFFPLVNRYADHPISRNLDASFFRFASSMDTVKAVGVKKIPLMMTSDYSRSVDAPVIVSINNLRKNLRPEDLQEKNIPLAYLLEGQFTSLYKNRFIPEGITRSKDDFLAQGKSKLVVVADGDFVENFVNPNTGQPQELGYNPYLKNKFANEDFVMNALAYLVEEDGIIQARSKEIRVRPLDKVQVNQEKVMWQMINLILPLVIIIIAGLFIYFYRKRKYTNFHS